MLRFVLIPRLPIAGAVFCLFSWGAMLPVEPASAQQPPQRPNRRPNPNRENEEPEPKPLPTDPKLLALHKDFVIKAEKLAAEYEKDKNVDKAIDCYEEILKLVPQYANAKTKLNELRTREATAQKVVIDVVASKGWQPTGVIVQPGKPIQLRAAGEWTFVLRQNTGPAGIQIPKELRDFNLGSLIAAIDTGNTEDFKPFMVGEKHSFIAEKQGKLVMRMYDTDPADNLGTMKVEIMGTFESGK